MFSNRILTACAAAALALLGQATMANAEQAAQLPAYKIVKSIPLGAPDKWDFVTFDPSSNRVFVSHRTKVDVVDVAGGKVVGSIAVGESHGVVIVPSLRKGYADDAAAKTLVVFDLKTLAKIAAPAVGVDADAVTYDPATGRVFVMNADGNSVSAVEAASGQAIKTVPLGGAPEMAAVDGKGTLFINVASTNEVVAFDTKALAVTKRWSVPACTKPHGLAMDSDTARLFVSCANARMLVLDAKTGATIADLAIGKGTDDAVFDASRKLAYSSNGEGTLSVIAEKSPSQFVSLGDAKTAPGARTMAIDSRTGRIFVVTADVAGTSAPETPGGRPHISFVPGSLKLLVLEPAS